MGVERRIQVTGIFQIWKGSKRGGGVSRNDTPEQHIYIYIYIYIYVCVFFSHY
jgi:hypothetical protein